MKDTTSVEALRNAALHLYADIRMSETRGSKMVWS